MIPFQYYTPIFGAQVQSHEGKSVEEKCIILTEKMGKNGSDPKRSAQSHGSSTMTVSSIDRAERRRTGDGLLG
jgi:hypothetical protein